VLLLNVVHAVFINSLLTISAFHPIPAAARSNALVCSSLLAGTVGSNPAGGNGCLYVVSVVCCQVEVLVSG